jgi:hypothetical protein
MKYLALICATAIATAPVSTAAAATRYDGPWTVVFATRTGPCDATYGLEINIVDGVLSHPNLVRFHGQVARSGVVHASLAVEDKLADGSGTLQNDTGRGVWVGSAAGVRCSGVWTAQRS